MCFLSKVLNSLIVNNAREAFSLMNLIFLFSIFFKKLLFNDKNVIEKSFKFRFLINLYSELSAPPISEYG